jgi:hypothetical protein
MILETATFSILALGAAKAISECLKSLMDRRKSRDVEVKLPSGERVQVHLDSKMSSAQRDSEIVKAVELSINA